MLLGFSGKRSRTSSTIHNAEHARLGAWVAKNSSWLALGMITAAFAIRFAYADYCYLNPDEATHFYAARASTWFETYKAAFMQAHPPLFILVLHGILFLGRTELILRLPSLVCGTVALWLTFAWIRRSLGEIPALAGLGFLALSPSAISASTEVRQYGLLLCFVCGALYATERTFSERSTMWATAQGLCLVGALLTHYTATVFLACLGFYVLIRSLLYAVPRRIFVALCLSQLSLLTLLGWLYFGHVRGSIQFGRGSSMDYLQPYYAAANESPLAFTWRTISGTFLYAAGDRRLAFLFMLVFLAGLGSLLTGRTRAPRLTTLLIVSPFAVGFVAAIYQVFPFAGSRHQTYLLPFLAAGISAAFACLQPGWGVRLLLVGVVIAPFWIMRAPPDNNPRTLPIGNMNAAIEYIKRMIPPGSPLFVDHETREVLRYYLRRNDKGVDNVRVKAGVEERVGGYRVVVPMRYVWAFHPDEALEQAAESARALGVPPGEPVWVVSASWLEPSLASRLPVEDNRDVKEFGRISVIRVSHWDEAQVTVNWSSTWQTIDGFGAATAGVNPQFSPALMDLFYGDSGIHLDFIRVEIWPNQAECEQGLAPGECVTSSNATISKIDLANAQAAVARGALVWGTEWSPPSSMKSNFPTKGRFLGGATNFANLADIQTSFVRLLTGTYGIPVYALSPQNEPDVRAAYTSCTWTAQQFHDYVPYLARALRNAGYGSVKIMIAEQSDWSNSFSTTAMNDAAVAADIGILAAHGYRGCCNAALSWNNLTMHRVWETEVSDNGSYDGSMTSALTYAREIHNSLTAANINAWHYWSLSGISFTDNEGLTDSGGNLAKRAYAIGNFSKFVLPGWTRVGTTNNTRLLVSAYRGPSGAAVVVVNSGPTVADQAFNVGTRMGTRIVPWITSSSLNLHLDTAVAVSSGSFTYTIPANSVVTFSSSAPVSVVRTPIPSGGVVSAIKHQPSNRPSVQPLF
jgi:glucuronoarabinoxylan endo-1,4-beta-xylanase